MSSGNEFLIPFGVDGKSFFTELNNLEAKSDQMVDNVVAGQKEVQKGFEASGQAADTFGKKLQEQGKTAASFAGQARDLGRDLGTALSGKSVNGDLEKKLNSFTGLLNKFSNAAGKKIPFNIDAQKLEFFEGLLEKGADSLEVLGQVSAYAKTQLAALDPNSQDFADLSAQIQVADGFLEGIGETTDAVKEKNTTLRTELFKMREELARLEIAGKGNTDEFLTLAKEAGHVQEKIQEVSKTVKSFASETTSLDAGIEALRGLAGAYEVANGVTALFGEENEAVHKAIMKVTGAMAILQGIQEVSHVLNKDSALSTFLFSSSQKTLATTTAAAGVALEGEAVATTAANAATKSWTVSLLANPIFIIGAAIAAVLVALVAFTSGSEDAEEASRQLNDELERQNELLELNEGSLERRTSLLVATAKKNGATESDITKIEGQSLAERINLRNAYLASLTTLYNDESNRKHRSAEEDKKLGDQIFKTENDLANLNNDLQVKRIELATQKDKEAEELSKKGLEARKKALAEQKAINDQQLKFAQELATAQLQTITNQYERERAESRLNLKNKIDDLNKEAILSVKAGKDRDKLIAQLRANQLEDEKTINKKEVVDRLALQAEAETLLNGLRKEGVVKAIEGIRLDFIARRKAVEDQYKDDVAQRKRLIKALGEAEAEQIKETQNKGAQDELKLKEENEILQVETAAKFIGSGAKVEKAKNEAVLKVKLDFAEQSLQLLLDQGNLENSTIVLQAQKLVQDLKGQLKTSEAGGNKSIFDLLGFNFNDEQGKAAQEAVKEFGKAFSEITDLVVSNYQRQIDKKQEAIDADNDAIDDLESQLEKEQQLREDGFANNVDRIQKELDAKKAARDEEIRQQEELQKRQLAIQKVQFAVDTISQTSNLVTSATAIFKGFTAAFPVIGVPLAIGTIAAMFAGFAASRIKAAQAIKEGSQSFGEGGFIDGKSHAAGGQKYISSDGTGGVVYLESGEHVTRKSQTEKYGDLLEAINRDQLTGMSDESLKNLLGGMGIHLSEDVKRGVQGARDKADYQAKLVVLEADRPGVDVSEINENLKYLAERKRNDPQSWEDETYFYTKQGNKTVRRKK